MWIERVRSVLLKERLNHFAAVVLLGPRQVGKTTLAEGVDAISLPGLARILEAQ